MKRYKPANYLLFILAFILLTGCNQEPLQPQSVVINLATVSEATGINEQIQQQLQTLNQQFSAEMRQLSEELGKEIEAEKTRLGDNPSAEDEKKIQTLRQELSKRSMQARAQGNARLAKQRAEITQTYIDSIMELAQQVAVEHGASIILKANGVFWSDASVDITGEVIARLPDSEQSEPVNSENAAPAEQPVSE